MVTSVVFAQGTKEWDEWYKNKEDYLINVGPSVGLALNLVTELSDLNIQDLQQKFDEYKKNFESVLPSAEIGTIHQLNVEIMMDIKRALDTKGKGADLENYNFYREKAVKTYIEMISEMEKIFRENGAPESRLSSFSLTLEVYEKVLQDIKEE